MTLLEKAANREDLPPESRGKTAFLLARALMANEPTADHRSRARSLAEQARELFADAGENFDEQRQEVVAFLEE